MPIPLPSVVRRLAWAAIAFVVVSGATQAAMPKVPDGFKIRLVAAVPAVQFPCQVASAPDGSLFVAEDPMDQVGPASQPIDRILLFREGKEPVVFADKLNAIFGMVWHDGALYVMNMPHLTVFRDRDGDGKADERKELFKDLGVPAGFPNDFNDHIVSGLKTGMDGYLYISVGDKGVPKATCPDGRTAQVVGGGTLRCRLDGTGLEVFSTGTRNHLEPNLDDRDNLFTYDNTDDGLGWWTRVTHHVDGGYYGYPYDYHKRTDRMLPRMAEYGGGSPCGGVFYGEDAWPEKYRSRLFWAEWGKRSVQAFRIIPDGATFKVADVIDFVESGDVESFRPLDLALSPDGRTMYVADWSMGGWGSKTEKLGRVYAVTYEGSSTVKTRPRGKDTDAIEAQIKQLDHPSYHERRRAQAALVRRGKIGLGPAVAALADPKTDPIARRHLVWVIDTIAGGTPEATLPLTDALRSPVADVRAQATRALGERAAPIAKDAIIELLRDREPTVRLQAVIALGRIGDHNAVPALLPELADKDAFIAFSARRALRRLDDWQAAARGLDSPDPKVREGILLAMEEVYDVEALRQLTRFAESAKRPLDERIKAVQFLAEVHRKAPPWDGQWWGTQPAAGKPPAKTIAWDGTPRVLAAARQLLRDPAARIRIAAIDALADANDQDSRATIRSRFDGEKDTQVRRAIALALGKLEDQQSLDLLIAALRNPHTPEPVRDASLEAVEMIGTDKATKALGELLTRKSLPADRQTGVIAALGRFQDPAAAPSLLGMLKAPQPPVRAAAVDALVAIVEGNGSGGRRSRRRAGERERSSARADVSRGVRSLLADPDVSVRHRAMAGLAALRDREAIPALLAAAESPESRFEAATALAAVPDMRALQVYLRGLADKNTDLRRASATAIANIRDKAAPVLDQLARRNELPPALVPELGTIYAGLAPIAAWRVVGPFPITADPKISPEKPAEPSASYEGAGGRRVTWRTVELADKRGQVDLGRTYSHDDDLAAYGYAEVESPSDRTAQMAIGSDDTLTVWLNGREVYRYSDRRGFDHEQARFDVHLRKGNNRVLIHCGNRGGPWQFAVAVTAPADFAFLKGPSGAAFNPEAYRDAAMKGGGDPGRGRRLFADLKGLACIKCHAVGKEGGNVGPELGSIGSKYPRDELIASVLYPSAKISSGYEPEALALSDGRVLTGIVRNETADAVEIQDADAKLVKVAKDDIDARKRSDVSLMPTGLAHGISPKDFADLIAYLEGLKNVDVNKK
jgi:putative membrane-bound dehydrogenase-like protein